MGNKATVMPESETANMIMWNNQNAIPALHLYGLTVLRCCPGWKAMAVSSKHPGEVRFGCCGYPGPEKWVCGCFAATVCWLGSPQNHLQSQRDDLLLRSKGGSWQWGWKGQMAGKVQVNTRKRSKAQSWEESDASWLRNWWQESLWLLRTMAETKPGRDQHSREAPHSPMLSLHHCSWCGSQMFSALPLRVTTACYSAEMDSAK